MRCLLLVCLLLCTAGRAYGLDGRTYTAGMVECGYDDPVSGTRTPMLVWYPTDEGARSVRLGFFDIDAAPQASPAEGHWPLVVISHGSGGTAIGHIGTALVLARHGHIVATPVHAGNAFGDNVLADLPAMWRGRPRQLSAALNAVLGDPVLGPRIDRGRIAAVGFSAGATTVLMAAGAVADLRLLAQRCSEQRDEVYCTAARLGYMPMRPPDPVIGPAPDARIRAVVAMAPVSALFPDGGLDRVTVPVRLYGARLDEELRSDHLDRVHALLPTAEVVWMKGAGHFAFMTPIPPDMRARAGAVAEDPPGFDRAAFQDRLNAEILAFLERTLAP